MSKIDIPFVKQKNDYFCGPASLQMVFSYFDFDTDQEFLAKKMKTDEDIGTKKKRMIRTVKKSGFHYCAKTNATLKELDSLIRKKIPVIVNYVEPTDEESHYAVVIGFSPKKIIFNDPWNGGDFRLDKKEFLKRWRGPRDGKIRWMLAIHNEPFPKCNCDFSNN